MFGLTRFMGAAFALLVALHAAPAGACSLDVRPVSFGTINLDRQNDGRGKITVSCPDPTAFEVGLGGPSGGRYMSGPSTQKLFYRLFADTTYSVDWGDGQAIGPTVGASSNGGEDVNLTIYGVVPAQPPLSPGEYSDNLIVTLIF